MLTLLRSRSNSSSNTKNSETKANWTLIFGFYGDLVYKLKIIVGLPIQKNNQKEPKIESENNFLTSIKGYNSVLICQN